MSKPKIHLYPSRANEYAPQGALWEAAYLGRYPRSSVLAGQDRWVIVETYDTLEDAQAAHPKAPVEKGPRWRLNPRMSPTPPDWFDPMDAGETW